MSENNQKTYVDGIWIRERKFTDGGSVLNVSFLVSKFAEFVKKNKKADGFVNIVISAKRNPDEKSTHYAYLDTYVPKSQSNNAPSTTANTQNIKPKELVSQDGTDF